MAETRRQDNEKTLERRLYTDTRLYSQPDHFRNKAGTDKITRLKLRIFSQSHSCTLSSLSFCSVGGLLCTGSKVCTVNNNNSPIQDNGSMQIRTQSNISSFFAIVAWKLGILRAWYRDDAWCYGSYQYLL